MGDTNDIIPSGTTGLDSPGKGMAIAAFVLAIVSFIPFLGILTSITAIVLGIIVLATHRAGKGFAIAGISVGVVFIILQFVLIIPVTLVVLLVGIAASTINSNFTGNYSDVNGFMPDSIVLTAPLYATYSYITTDNIGFDVRNSGGENIIIKSVDFSVNSPASVICEEIVEDKVLNIGEEASFSTTCSGIKYGDLVNADIKIQYTNQDGTLTKESEGLISGKAY